MASKSVTQNGDPVHVATAIKVDLQLIGSRPIIHLFPFQTTCSSKYPIAQAVLGQFQLDNLYGIE